MSKKKTLIIAAGVLACVGAVAAVSAQGHRGHWRGGPGQFGGEDGFGLGGSGMGGQGGGDFRGRFAGPLKKDEFDGRTRERFARLDKNSDGVIDAAEIEASMTERQSAWRQMMNKGGPGMDDQIIRMFDTNKDGKVTKDEFVGAVRKQFAEMDLNNDGRITDDDLPPLMRGRNVLAGGQGGAPGQGPGTGPGMGPGTGQGFGGRPGMGFPLLRLLQGADANKDGIITLDEVLAAADTRFLQFDRNKDGVIDKADFDQLRKEMVEYRVKRFIHHFGADKDGKVTREQFNAKAAERFAQMDLNNDGTISREERPGGGRGFGRGRGGPDQGGPGGPGMGPGGDRGPRGPGGPDGPRRPPGDKQ